MTNLQINQGLILDNEVPEFLGDFIPALQYTHPYEEGGQHGRGEQQLVQHHLPRHQPGTHPCRPAQYSRSVG